MSRRAGIYSSMAEWAVRASEVAGAADGGMGADAGTGHALLAALLAWNILCDHGTRTFVLTSRFLGITFICSVNYVTYE